jgi:hypothetical protein
LISGCVMLNQACVPRSKNMYVQWYLGLRVTWSASVLQDEQKLLINFNLINERCLAIRVLYYLYALSAERHVITSRPGL